MSELPLFPLHTVLFPGGRLPLPLAAKQELLEIADAAARLERLNALLRASARAES